MTIGDAINKTLEYKEGYEYKYEQLMGWLNTCEKMIWECIIKHYQRDDMPEKPEYNTSTPETTVLIVPEPFSDLYVHYLCAQMCYWNRETTGYINAKEQYEALLNAFQADYMEKYPHICNTYVKGAI